MTSKHYKLVSLVASLAMLAYVFSWCFVSPALKAELRPDRTHKQQVFCAGVSSSSFFAELKARFAGITPSKTSDVYMIGFLSLCKTGPYVAASNKGVVNSSPPLWLLNRALLI